MPRELIERLWTRGREFLGVRYPILGGAMTWISESSLVSAICNAGAFGVLAGGNMPPELLKEEIRQTRRKTDRPFGVNLITVAPNFQRHLDDALDLALPFVILAGGLPPREAMSRIKAHGQQADLLRPHDRGRPQPGAEGVDALVIEGHEAGGHIGPVSTAVLAEQILPTIESVPVFVAGGIGSGVMMVHYLMMGAAGVQLGTKFSVAEESVAHPNFKQAMIRASARAAQPTHQFDPRIPVIPVRALQNEGTRDFNTLQLGLIAQLERRQLSAQDAGRKLEEFWIGGLRRAAIEGDVEHGSLMAGQSVELVRDILPVAKIIDRLIDEAVAEAEKILARLGR